MSDNWFCFSDSIECMWQKFVSAVQAHLAVLLWPSLAKKTCIVGSFVAFKGKKMRMRMRKDDILKQQQTYKVFQFHDKSHYKTNAMKILKDI